MLQLPRLRRHFIALPWGQLPATPQQIQRVCAVFLRDRFPARGPLRMFQPSDLLSDRQIDELVQRYAFAPEIRSAPMRTEGDARSRSGSGAQCRNQRGCV
jgi:hypothetical protein